MKHSLVRANLRLAAIAQLAAAGCTILAGCSGTPGTQEVQESPSTPIVGVLDVDLQIDPGVTLGSIAYSIAGPASFTKSGSIDVHNSSSLSAVISPIPVGTGFTITLSGTGSDGTTTCGGGVTFDITAGHTTTASVHLACHESPNSGSVLLSGSLNVCPSIDGVGASPASVFVGGTSHLTGAAHDLDHAPSPLAFHWTTDLGTLSDAAAQNPTLTCSQAGTAHVSLSVSDGDPLPSCADSRSMAITCTPLVD